MQETVIAAFSEEHTSQLTGVSRAQLRYWDRIEFYQPAYGSDERSSFSRVYSFKDIVALRVLDTLRNQFRVKLGHLRDVKETLSFLLSDDDLWTGVKLYALNGQVVWIEPETGAPQVMISGQYVVPVILDDVVRDTRRSVALLNQRDTSKRGRIERVRNISHNAPVIAGTRIPVAAIKRYAGAGYSTEYILREYPDLTAEDVDAALAYDDLRSAA
jgi:uncharacterized protein (DUF433 family)